MKIQNDKLCHLYAGAIIAWFTIVVMFGFTDRIFIISVSGIIAATSAGIAKELIYDKLLRKGTPDHWDAIYTFFGGSITVALLNIWILLGNVLTIIL
jgi:hypothetical protein